MTEPSPMELYKSNERYVPQFKKNVLAFLQEKGDDDKVVNSSSMNSPRTIAQASAKFHVHPTTISDWLKEYEREVQMRELQEKHELFTQNELPCSSSHVDTELPISDSLASVLEGQILHFLQNFRNSNKISKYVSICRLQDELSAEIKQLYSQSKASKTSWIVQWCSKVLSTNVKNDDSELIEIPTRIHVS